MKKRSLNLLFQLCLCLLFSLEVFAQPAVTTFSPSSGQVGTLVTINGTSLGSASSVSIGGINAIIVSNTSTSIVALVMPGATTGALSVTTGAGTGNSIGNFTIAATVYPETQQGNKLVGTNGIDSPQQGVTVSISADGNTALVGGFADNSFLGAAWVFTRSNSTWSQQGTKLLPFDNVGSNPRFGKSVALSADGNTAIIGGDTDNSGVGAGWVFTRSGSTWTQQQKLTANDNSAPSLQGTSVAMSADGNTALVGGNNDNSGMGAGWIFTRSSGVWSQQGNKLVGTGSVATPAGQGFAAALSADGNTALLGGPGDNNGNGAIWVFVRNSGVWSQQGNKLVGTNTGNGAAGQGFSVALSADGNTAISGGINDNGLAGVGGAWTFSRTGNTWTEQTKLVGTGASGLSAQGHSVSLSADGNTAAVGGIFDDLSQGAIWLFKRDGSNWTQQGSKLKGTGMENEASQGFSVALSADGKTMIAGGPSDANGLGASWIFSTSTLSADANLSALSLGSGTLSPTFSSATLAYSASVLNSMTSVTVTPTRAQANATIEVRVNGGSFATVVSGTASNALPLNVGSNTIDVKVTAQDGSTTKSYVLTLTRANPVPVINSLSPSTIIAGASAVITVNGLNFGSSIADFTSATYGVNGTEQAATNLAWVSATQIQFTTAAVTAGTTNKVTVTVGGQASVVSSVTFTAVSNNADLSALSLGSGTLSPTFSSATLAYSASVLNSTTSVTVTPTRAQANATIEVRVNGGSFAAVSSGTASNALALNVGSNTIEVKVTAQDGTTTKSYALTLTRANPAPVITGVSPSKIIAGSAAVITVTGLNFGNSTSDITSATYGANGTEQAGTNLAWISSTHIQFTTAALTAGTTHKVIVTVGGQASEVSTVSFSAVSNNADLSALTLSSGTLSPGFSSSTLAYSASVLNSTVSVTPTRAQSNATIEVRVNGGTFAAVSSGTASNALALNVGSNTIEVKVTAQDGTTIKSYTLTVNRANPVPVISSVSPSTMPAGLPALITITGINFGNSASDLNGVTYGSSGNEEVGIKPTWLSSTQIQFTTAVLTSTDFNSVMVTVGGQVSTRSSSLFIAVASQNADLASLTSSNYTLSPVFATATTSYTASVANTVTSVSMVPTAAQANATIKINNVDVTSGSSGTVQLVVGANNISVVVRAQDQISTKTYTVVITRSAQTLAVNEVAPDANGNVTVTTVKPEVKVTSPTQAVTVTVPAGTTNTTVDYSTLLNAPGKATVPQTTINSDVSKVTIPASTVFTASSPAWDGVITAPKVDIWTPPASDDETITTPGLVIQMGHPTISFSLSRAIRLILPAQAGMRTAYIHRGVYKEITTVGPSDSQAAGDALPTDGIFKIDAGADLVIWTKVLSQFLTFTQTTDLNVAIVTSDAAAISANDIKGVNTDLNNITTTLANPLPSLGAGGSAITWTSSNPAVISNNGQTLTRPVQGSPFPAVTMTATVKKGLITRTQTFAVTVIPLPNQAPTMAAIANQTLCFTTAQQLLTVTGISPGPETNQTTTLSVSSSDPALLSGLAANSTTGVISFTPLNTAGGTATITVTATDNGGTVGGGVNTFSRTFTIRINPLPTVQIFNSIGTNDVSKGLTLNITASGGSFYSWANASGIISGQNTAALTIRPTVTTTYTVTVTDASGCVNTQSVTINVLEDYRALDINNLLSPNGDGVNDALVIKNLDMYPNNTVRIFDAAGRMLYSKQNYTNDWNGSFQGSPLTEGTYYYIVDFGNGKKILRGFVSIVNQQ